MGDGEAVGGWDERQVTLTRDFYLGQHEVTNQEYLESVQWAYDHGYVTASTLAVWDNLDGSTTKLLDLEPRDCEIAFSQGVFSIRDMGYGIHPDHPVFYVTWCGAARYCDWLSLRSDLQRAYVHNGDWSCHAGEPYSAEGYRLPTDAEWEYAAQYNDDRTYPWGNESPTCALANHYGCAGWTSPVGSCPAGDSELGLSDMAGNVWEWCNDWRVWSLGTSPATDPVGPEDGGFEGWRVLRGGGWQIAQDSTHDLRCATRMGSGPGNGFHAWGFRVARTAAP
jgi:formylglycine-generating enzyme required for sulfatase activity